jgi:hypothetical protein
MTTPCENKDDIKSLHTKVDTLTDAFQTFRLNTSIDVAILKTEAKADGKKAGGIQGGFWGALVVIVATAIEYFTK